MYAFYPGYMFIYCQWGPSVENVVRGSVPITTLFLKDEDAQVPHRLTDAEMTVVRAEVERWLDVMGTQESPLGFDLGHTVRVIRGPYMGQTGKVTEFDNGRVIIELTMFNREMGIPFDAKDLQIL
jgi:transcriptional antiterminator NusG